MCTFRSAGHISITTWANGGSWFFRRIQHAFHGRVRVSQGVLAAVDAIDGLERSHLWHAARADALRRLDRTQEAAAALRTALGLAVAAPDRALLTARLRELTGPRDDPPG